MSLMRFFYNAGADVVSPTTLTSAVNGVHINDFNAGSNPALRGYRYLTIAWSHVNSSASALTWTAEISMDGTNYVDVSEAIIQSGADELEQHNPKITVSGNATGTFTVPMPAGRKCRITCTATGAAAGDTIAWKACAHD